MHPKLWQQIEELYLAAEQASGEERDLLLAGSDPEVRVHVERMLAQRSQEQVLDLPPPVMERTEQLLAPGSMAGPYQIESVLGAGGMGAVYRAFDSRLGRKVAIKVAGERFSARFEREARHIAALNHPHICTVYDVGPNYLVLELVEGETLEARLRKGKLTFENVVRHGAQVANALWEAHSKGIIHRDLKPANIMLSKQGVKVLDFGIAKSPQDPSLTGALGIVGTPAYMAPEQLDGTEADARSDIFALGIVLYEAVTGERLTYKSGPVQMDGVPPQLAHVIERCLAPDPKDRWQTARDLEKELVWAGEVLRTAQAGEGVRKAAERPGFRILMWFAIMCIAVLAVSLSFWRLYGLPGDRDHPLAGAQYSRVTDFEGSENDVAISRDGRFIVFRSDRDGPVDTWLTQLGSGEFVNLTRGGRPSILVRNAGFTPDGSQVWLGAIVGGDRLRIMPLMGGAQRPFLRERGQNVAWSADGSRLVYHTNEPGDPMFVADRSGSNAREIYRLKPGGHSHYPVWSKDGQWIYFISGIWETREMDLWRVSPDSPRAEKLTSHNADLRYLSLLDDRTLLYVAPGHDGAGPWLWAYDVLRGTTKRISSGLEVYTSVDVSGDGRRVVGSVSATTANLWRVPILDRVTGVDDVKQVPLPSVRAFAPRYGGSTLFYLSSRGGGDGLWRYDNGQALEVWRGSEGSLLEPAAVSFDGRRVAVILRKQGKRTLTLLSGDGGDVRSLAPELDIATAASWSPDGQWIVAGATDNTGNSGLFKIPVQGGAPQRLATGIASNPVWSPDGSIIVYTGPIVGIMGTLQLVRPDGTAMKSPEITVRVGTEHYRFAPGGRQLIYVPTPTQADTENFWSLDLASGQSRRLSSFDVRSMRTFDVTPDGKQIVFDRIRENSDIVLIDLPK